MLLQKYFVILHLLVDSTYGGISKEIIIFVMNNFIF